MAIELVIFDLDGTLVDSIADIAGAVNHALCKIGSNTLSLDEVRRLVGSGVEHLLLRAAGIDNIDDHDIVKKDILKSHFLSHYTEHIADKSRPYDNVIKTLDTLSGIKKAVASNKLESLSRRLLDKLSMLKYFDAVYGYDSCHERKPSPVPLIKLMEVLGTGISQTIIIGDSGTDIEAGRAAGIKTIAVSYGYRSVDSLKDADYIIDDLSEIIPIIKAIN
ncbi:HAD family hydrolase [Candidatus Magnetominusculus xianensis]|uniref:phosphoglycolate phosphatase n=1 Tax=Candidatus Magnetominusculus xianensis TaxID=1748249 RepID=A0ABR5SH32_9BACT|nr:HAD-IA family hydrolase [Candidatus Magnetominusculus xianensis]KWT91001.1 phosphoglycolate phosphatase [Candidatus Magnetominusculus xianensis]MBF0402606.1 HAD-IA family hydrolase [Nitrospirota bacterium]